MREPFLLSVMLVGWVLGLVMVGYGVSTLTAPTAHCLQRPWLDTSGGC